MTDDSVSDSVSDWGVKVKIACSACSVRYALDYVKYAQFHVS